MRFKNRQRVGPKRRALTVTSTTENHTRGRSKSVGSLEDPFSASHFLKGVVDTFFFLKSVDDTSIDYIPDNTNR